MKGFLTRNKLLIVIGLLAVLGIAGGLTVLHYYRLLASPNIHVAEGEVALNIPDADWDTHDVICALSEKADIRNVRALEKAMARLDYETVRSGHYIVTDGMSNKALVDMLRRGLQTPVLVTFHNLRTKQDLAASLSRQLMPDSASIMALLNDSVFLAGYGLNVDNALTLFIPNTYEFFWNVDAPGIFDRMKREYDRFWTDERQTKAAAIPLTPAEVSTLASIVEEETNIYKEYPIVAGLYINRLKRGMLLQADPTVKYAVGDFSLRRILNVHLETESPYNTYLHPGLPPGPIRIPSARAIDAVLNYQHHRYLYMVAKETLDGSHNFATNLRDHTNNAIRYQRALNRMRIYR